MLRPGSFGPQEAALIWELRRLQRFLDEECDQERFPHAIDLQSKDRPPRRPRGRAKTTCEAGRQQGRAATRQAWLNRRNRQKAAVRAASRRQAPARQDAKVLFHPASDARTSAAHSSSPGLTRITLQDRIGSPTPAERKNRCGQPWWRDRVFSGRVSHGSACAQATHSWWAGRRLIGLDGPETALRKRLMRAFEGELKTGLRVLIIGVGIVGGWACSCRCRARSSCPARWWWNSM